MIAAMPANRATWIVLGAVLLAAIPACHLPDKHPSACTPGTALAAGGALAAAGPVGTLPPEAYRGPMVPPPMSMPLGPPGMEYGVPVPYCPLGPWAPPGIARPWPQDEYLCDGGDRGLPVGVTPDWEVRGLDMEDAVGHYDTLDGRTVVEPSNRVCIYAPRFGAVRQVVGAVQNEQADHTAGVVTPVAIVRAEDTRGPRLNKQQIPVSTEIGSKVLTTYESKQHEGRMSNAVRARGLQDAFQSYEDLAVIRMGLVREAEGPMLAKGINAAIIWSRNQAAQVLLDRKMAAIEVGDQGAGVVYTIKEPPANPKLRVIKVASTPFAEPGDTVSFTIRFDNVGNQKIGNVTIVDNLTTRLEYEPDSAQSSVPTQFSCKPNEGGSLVLRWEITEPLAPGQGGIVRFNCRVR